MSVTRLLLLCHCHFSNSWNKRAVSTRHRFTSATVTDASLLSLPFLPITCFLTLCHCHFGISFSQSVCHKDPILNPQLMILNCHFSNNYVLLVIMSLSLWYQLQSFCRQDPTLNPLLLLLSYHSYNRPVTTIPLYIDSCHWCFLTVTLASLTMVTAYDQTADWYNVTIISNGAFTTTITIRCKSKLIVTVTLVCQCHVDICYCLCKVYQLKCSLIKLLSLSRIFWCHYRFTTFTVTIVQAIVNYLITGM